MAVQLGYTDSDVRMAKIENEIDRMNGRRPRNRYTCTVCYGDRRIDASYHGSPEWEDCVYCAGGKKIDEANARLDRGEG